MSGKSRIYSHAIDDNIRQGEIITNLVQVKIDLDSIGNEDYVGTDVVHPIAIVVTQDCDLEQDYKARYKDGNPRRLLPNILFCEVETAKEMIYGERNSNVMKSNTIRDNFTRNDDFRFHFLQAAQVEEDILGEGLPEMGIEFKRYFTIPSDEVYYRIRIGEAKRRCKLNSPYLEHFSTRFHYYHYRVALPDDHSST